MGEAAYDITPGEPTFGSPLPGTPTWPPETIGTEAITTVLNAAGVVAAVVLAAVLVAAARAKASDRAGTTNDFEALGLVGAGVLSTVVPVAEVATAVVLVVAPPYGGPIAFAILAGFTVVLWRAQRHSQRTGRPLSCACFGGTGSTPISNRHLVRNAALMGLALLATASTWTLFAAV